MNNIIFNNSHSVGFLMSSLYIPEQKIMILSFFGLQYAFTKVYLYQISSCNNLLYFLIAINIHFNIYLTSFFFFKKLLADCSIYSQVNCISPAEPICVVLYCETCGQSNKICSKCFKPFIHSRDQQVNQKIYHYLNISKVENQ